MPEFILGLALLAIILFIFRRKVLPAGVLPNREKEKPPAFSFPETTKENDKLILVKGVTDADIKTVLKSFCKMYNEERDTISLRLITLSENEFAITFPYDIEFDIFCYLVNYLQFPIETKWTAAITGWTTAPAVDDWVTEKTANKRAMLFISPDDTEYDNVYLTTFDNIGYKLGFAKGEENQFLERPKKRYTDPDYEIAELAGKVFIDMR